jgi:hypothetical protein
MRFRFFVVISLALCAISFLLPHQILAATPSDIAVSILPPNPNPNENVTLSLSSYSLDLNTATIEWVQNGKVSLSGIGKKSFSTTMGGVGTTTNVTINVRSKSGTVQQKISLSPNSLVLLWQANDSYVPPFYKGKALATPGSLVKVVAMPEVRRGGSFLNSENMTYSWQEDTNNDQGASGYGKNYLIYTIDYLDRTNTIGVNASTVDQSYSSDANVTISTVNPKISFYLKDPSLGTLWSNALSGAIQISGEATLAAAPYFISPKNILSSRLNYSWYINDLLTNTENLVANLLPLKVQTGQTGISTIRLNIESKDKIFESAKKEINIQF